MYRIQANQRNTRFIDVSDEHLQTIEKYSLFRNLIDSNGFVDETVLDKLRLNARAILESDSTASHKDLLDLCLDVIYNQNMKAFGLHKLILLYLEWQQKQQDDEVGDSEQNISD